MEESDGESGSRMRGYKAKQVKEKTKMNARMSGRATRKLRTNLGTKLMRRACNTERNDLISLIGMAIKAPSPAT